MSSGIRVVSLSLALLLGGCMATTEPVRKPAPVVDGTGSNVVIAKDIPEPEVAPQQAGGDDGVEIVAYQAPRQVRPEPVTSGAVKGLLQKADKQRQAGDRMGAASSLERALRIEPRNAHLWNRLARVRLEQKQFSQAADLAAKSNSLAASDRWLRQDNWRLISQAKRGSGDLDGARAAEQKAAALR